MQYLSTYEVENPNLLKLVRGGKTYARLYLGSAFGEAAYNNEEFVTWLIYQARHNTNNVKRWPWSEIGLRWARRKGAKYPGGYKGYLIEHMAILEDAPGQRAQEALEIIVDEIASALVRGERVTLGGFGTFRVNDQVVKVVNGVHGGEVETYPKALKFIAHPILADAMN